MRYDNSYYYLTDEDIADMRYESMENFAKNAVLAFAGFVVFTPIMRPRPETDSMPGALWSAAKI